eukprot:TRINITY_DN6317_c2_g1_i1.p1 TRINITY_DN6317_c2_g1~~TRINITY_DN6317_c2_g1_i1.p1  ORF type:complete len:910 (+),score=277.51 TRINITY_DN6317_c2_g1_i1:151-2880(+)
MGNASSNTLLKATYSPVAILPLPFQKKKKEKEGEEREEREERMEESLNSLGLISVSKKGFELFKGSIKPSSHLSPFKGISHTCAILKHSSSFNLILITGNDDGNFRIFQVWNGGFVRSFPEEAPMEDAKDTHFQGGNSRRQLLSSSNSSHDGFNDQFSTATHKPITCLLALPGDKLVAGGSDGFIRLFSLAEGEIGRMLNTISGSAPITALAFDSNRQIVFAGDFNGRICGFIVESGLKLEEYVGHSQSICALEYCKQSDVLVSASSDTSVRLWNVENGQQIDAYELASQTMIYDELRDILFIGHNDGSFSISKVILNQNSSAELRISKRTNAHKGFIQLMTYSTERDALITSSSDNKIGYWSNVTSISHSQALQSKHSSESNKETDKLEDNLVCEIESKQVVDAISLPLIDSEKRNLDLYLGLLEGEEDSDSRKETLKKGFYSAVDELQSALDKLSNQFSVQKGEVGQTFQGVLNTESEEIQMEQRFEQLKEQLRLKHEREWAELNNKIESERKTFESQIPVMKKQASSQILALKKKYHHLQHQMETNVSKSLRKFMKDSFPIINSKYQIGNRVSKNSSTVFRGLNMDTFELVVLKAFPSEVSLNTSLRHETLVPVLDICPNEGTTFAIMRLLNEDLPSFVSKHNNQQLEDRQIASIIYTLFKSLTYLHSNRVVVRDLSPHSILMDEKGRPRLMQLGVMRILDGIEPFEEGRSFSAPEIYCRVVKGSSDIWSLGCVFLYLLQTREERSKPLFRGSNAVEVLKSMIDVVGKPHPEDLNKMARDCKMDGSGSDLLKQVNQFESEEEIEDLHSVLKKIASKAPPLALDLLSKMLSFVSFKRVRAVEALTHPYFHEFGFFPSFSESEQQPQTDITTSDGSDNEYDSKFVNEDEVSLRVSSRRNLDLSCESWE